MSRFLEAIVAAKRDEVAALAAEPRIEMPRDAGAVRRFSAALDAPGIAVIAEIKRRSPSRGALREGLCAATLARDYQAHGASALSVLTDRRFFGATATDLGEAREAVTLPVLRKDFLVDPLQLHESRAMGADAVLLIVRILDRPLLRDLLALAAELGLDALVEVHDERELATALECGARVVGVNSRDLDTFEVDLATARRLAERIPDDRIAVAESGIHTRADVRLLEQSGYDAVLVGEALVRAPVPGAALAALLRDGA